MNFFGKNIFFFLVLVIIFNSSNGFFMPDKADAIATSQLWAQITEIGKVVESTVGSWTRWAEEKMGKKLRDIVAKKMMDYIVDETVKWIQGGGEPKFIGNWNVLLKEAGDIAFEEVVNELGVAGLCQPFGIQVRLTLLPVKKFYKRAECTLDKVVSNIENFYIDFSVGGWNGYLASFEPQNNFYGQVIMAYDEITKRSQENKEAAKSEGIAGGGFLSTKKCVAYEEVDLKECETYYGVNDACVKEKENNRKCLKEEIITPGDTVGKVMGEAVTSDSKWAANIQSWTSALVNAAINRLFQEGLRAMVGSAQGGRIKPFYPSDYQDLVTSDTQQTKNTLTKEAKSFLSEWQAISNYKNLSLSYAEQMLADLKEIKLNNCMVTDGEISTASSTVSVLQSEVNDLNNKIKEATDVINQIESAKTNENLMNAQYAYNKFRNKYGELMWQQITSGDVRNSAKAQSEDLYNQLYGTGGNLSSGLSIDQRLKICTMGPGGKKSGAL